MFGTSNFFNLMNLKEKSERSLESANLLSCNARLNNSSVHCAYYSCYQLILYYIDYHNVMNEDDRKNEYDNYKINAKSQHKLGLHEYWISVFENILNREGKYKCNYRTIHYIINKVKELKEYRSQADYTETEFDVAKTLTIYNDAYSVINDINNILN